MSDIIRIWVETTHNSAFRSGGWAYVLAEGSARLGAAGGGGPAPPARGGPGRPPGGREAAPPGGPGGGGERRPSREGGPRPGLGGALTPAPAGGGGGVRSPSPAVIALPARLTAAQPPEEDLDLWAPLTAALEARTVAFGRTANAPKT